MGRWAASALTRPDTSPARSGNSGPAPVRLARRSAAEGSTPCEGWGENERKRRSGVAWAAKQLRPELAASPAASLLCKGPRHHSSPPSRPAARPLGAPRRPPGGPSAAAGPPAARPPCRPRRPRRPRRRHRRRPRRRRACPSCCARGRAARAPQRRPAGAAGGAGGVSFLHLLGRSLAASATEQASPPAFPRPPAPPPRAPRPPASPRPAPPAAAPRVPPRRRAPRRWGRPAAGTRRAPRTTAAEGGRREAGFGGRPGWVEGQQKWQYNTRQQEHAGLHLGTPFCRPAPAPCAHPLPPPHLLGLDQHRQQPQPLGGDGIVDVRHELHEARPEAAREVAKARQVVPGGTAGRGAGRGGWAARVLWPRRGGRALQRGVGAVCRQSSPDACPEPRPRPGPRCIAHSSVYSRLMAPTAARRTSGWTSLCGEGATGVRQRERQASSHPAPLATPAHRQHLAPAPTEPQDNPNSSPHPVPTPTCAHARYLRYESDRKVAGHSAAHAPIARMTSARTRSSTSLRGWTRDGGRAGARVCGRGRHANQQPTARPAARSGALRKQPAPRRQPPLHTHARTHTHT
jgi:hypothetical protein